MLTPTRKVAAPNTLVALLYAALCVGGALALLWTWRCNCSTPSPMLAARYIFIYT